MKKIDKVATKNRQIQSTLTSQTSKRGIICPNLNQTPIAKSQP